MSNKAKTITIRTPSRRIIHTAVPSKAKSAPIGDMSLLGDIVKIVVDPETKKKTVVETGFVVYEITGTLEVVLVQKDLESLIKNVGEKTLDLLIKGSNLTPLEAVAQGMAKFTHSLPTEGYYVLQGAKHVHVEELPAEEPAKEPEASTPKETQGEDQTHF